MSDRTVVFVCLHGAAKSLIAATLFQRLADERGLAVRSTFAGTEPDPAIQPCQRSTSIQALQLLRSRSR